MQFIVIARDKKNSLKKRMKAREDHISLWDKMVKANNALYWVALLGEDKNMNGSVYIVDFESRLELDERLKIEPYVLWDVWANIEIIECKVWPSFLK